MKSNLEKAITLKSASKKKAAGETLSVQEKKLISQDSKHEKLAVIEKKKRLKKSVSKKEEYHGENDSTIFTGDTPNQVFDSYDEQRNIDNMTLGDIIGRIGKSKEAIPSPDIDEKKKLLEMFRTDVPSEIDEIIAREEMERNASLSSPHNTPWDDYQNHESAAIRAEKFTHHEKPPKGRWFENIRPAKENPHADLINSRKYVAHEDVYANEDGTEDRVTRYKDGTLGSSMNKKPYIQPETINRESKKEKLEKKKGFLDRVKKWFIKDPHLIEDALYDQNRQEIDRMLDENTERAGYLYDKSLTHDQEAYDARTRNSNPMPSEGGRRNEEGIDFKPERGNL